MALLSRIIGGMFMSIMMFRMSIHMRLYVLL